MRLTKEQSRERWRQLRDLTCEWDPIGAISIGAPRDEYDCLLGPLLRLLEENASEEQIFQFLDNQLRSHFELPGITTTRDFANVVKSWYDSKWPASTVQSGLAE